MKNHCCSAMGVCITRPGFAVRYNPVFREYYIQTFLTGQSLIEIFKNFGLRDDDDIYCSYENSGKEFFMPFLRMCFCYDQERKNSNKGYIRKLKWCPFCGKKLPEVLEDEWMYAIIIDYGCEYMPKYKELWDKGILDKTYAPQPQSLPKEFTSDKWWKNRRLNTKQGWKNWVEKVNKWLDENPHLEPWLGRKIAKWTLG